MAMFESLEDAREWLRERASKGARCPCCQQRVKIYPRRLGEEHCVFLKNLLRHKNDPEMSDWVHHSVANTYKNKNSRGYHSLQWFGLAETGACGDLKPKKKMSGYWRITPKGEAFLRDRLRVPKYIYTYNAEVVDVSEETVNVIEALPVNFNYYEMISETVPPGTQYSMF